MANLSRPLYINVKQDILAVSAPLFHFGDTGAIQMTMHLCPFQETTRLLITKSDKLFRRYKMVMHAVDLARAWLPGGVRYGKNQGRQRLHDLFENGGFTAA